MATEESKEKATIELLSSIIEVTKTKLHHLTTNMDFDMPECLGVIMSAIIGSYYSVGVSFSMSKKEMLDGAKIVLDDNYNREV